MQSFEKLAPFKTPELSDAMDSLHLESVLLGIKPMFSLPYPIIGPIYTVKYASYETPLTQFMPAGDYIDHVPKGAVVIIDNEGREDCSTWGGILSQMALLRGVEGVVIHGACRDVASHRELNLPVFAKTVVPRSGKNRVHKKAEQCPLHIGQVSITPGDIFFGDNEGALVIPKQYVNEVIEKAHRVQLTEQAIINTIQSGSPLHQARKQHRYETPWENASSTF